MRIIYSAISLDSLALLIKVRFLNQNLFFHFLNLNNFLFLLLNLFLFNILSKVVIILTYASLYYLKVLILNRNLRFHLFFLANFHLYILLLHRLILHLQRHPRRQLHLRLQLRLRLYPRQPKRLLLLISNQLFKRYFPWQNPNLSFIHSIVFHTISQI